MCVDIVVEVRLLLKYLFIDGSTVFVSSVFNRIHLVPVWIKKLVWNFSALRRSRNIYLKAVATVPIELGRWSCSFFAVVKLRELVKNDTECRSCSVKCCSDLRGFILLLSVCLVLFSSDNLSSNENASYSKRFINVDSELLLVYWVFKLQILYSKACFTRQAPFERFMATFT